MLRLSQALSEDDVFFLELYASTRKDEVAAFGWPEQQLGAFLQMQYQTQKRAYAVQYPSAECCLVRFGGERIGRLIIDESPSMVVLADIALLPQFQNRGFGSDLIRGVQRRAEQGGKMVCLHVLQASRAIHLYERLGFLKTEERTPYQRMEWCSSNHLEAGAEPELVRRNQTL